MIGINKMVTELKRLIRKLMDEGESRAPKNEVRRTKSY